MLGNVLNEVSLRVAHRYLYSAEMTQDEWKSYKKEHPGADIKNHTIVKSPGGGAAPEDSKMLPANPLEFALSSAVSGGKATFGDAIDAFADLDDQHPKLVKQLDAVEKKFQGQGGAKAKAILKTVSKAKQDLGKLKELIDSVAHANQARKRGDKNSPALGAIFKKSIYPAVGYSNSMKDLRKLLEG